MTISVFMSLMPIYVQAEDDIAELTGLTNINISCAGTEEMWWVTASDGIPEGNWMEETGIPPETVWFMAGKLFPDYEPLEYFFAPIAENTVSNHELTLYGYKDLDTTKLSVGGVRADSSGFTKTVYGSGELALYGYSTKISVHSVDCNLQITYDGKTVKEIPCKRIANNVSKFPYATEFYPYDYTEDAHGYISSFSIQMSGFFLPTNPSDYSMERYLHDDTGTANGSDTTFATCKSVSEPDEFGRIIVGFEMNAQIEAKELLWLNLRVKGAMIPLPLYYFSTSGSLEKTDEKYYFRNYADSIYTPNGMPAAVPSPYCCFYKPENTVHIPSFTVPIEVSSTPAVIGITPNDYEGGQIAYSVDGEQTFSSWQNIGTSISVSLTNGNGSYGIVFKFKKDGLEEK